jgi:hypothetical protein
MGSHLGPVMCVAAACAGSPAAAAEWLDARKLPLEELRRLCARASDAKMLARVQMLSSPDAMWRKLSRQALAIERVTMGEGPLDATKCYIIARAGSGEGGENSIARRAFEVRDFAHGERTLILVVGAQIGL